LATRKENQAVGRKIARKITLEMKDDVLTLLPEGPKAQITQIEALIFSEQEAIGRLEALLMRILKKTAGLLMTTPVIGFNKKTGILQIKGISGKGELESLVNKLGESDETKKHYLQTLLEKLTGRSESTVEKLTPAKLTQLLAERGLNDEESPLIKTMAQMVMALTSPVDVGQVEEGEEIKVTSTFRNVTRLALVGDPFAAAFLFAGQMAKIALAEKGQGMQAVSDMLQGLLGARERDVERGIDLATKAGRLETLALQEELQQAIIRQYKAQLDADTFQQEMVLEAQESLVGAVTNHFTAQLKEYEKVEGYLRELQSERDELWYQQAKAELEKRRDEVLAQIETVRDLTHKYYLYVQDRAETLGNALLTATEYSAKYADKYRDAMEKVANPEGSITQNIIKAQRVLREHWGIRVSIPLPIISAPSSQLELSLE
jgi:hypothetical protein